MSRSKLWKQIGVSGQKYDRPTELSPSYERSSVGKSIENKSQSSNSLRLQRGKNSIQKNQNKSNLNEEMKLFTSKHYNNLDFRLTQVPQQQENYFKHILLQKVKFQGPLDEEQVQIHLLNELQKTIKKPLLGRNQSRKNDLPKLKQNIHQLNQCQVKVKQYVTLTLKNFKNYVQKFDQNLKNVFAQLSKQLASKNYQIKKLQCQNNKLRHQLLKTFEMIEQLQTLNEENRHNSYTTLKNLRNHTNIFNAVCNSSQLKLSSKKYTELDQQIAKLNDSCLFDFRALNSTDLHNCHNMTKITQRQTLKRINYRQSSTQKKRQKFKRFLQTKYSLRKKQSNISEAKQKKSGSLPRKNISDIKFCRNIHTIQDKQYLVKKISNDSIESIINEKFYRKISENAQNPKILRFNEDHVQAKLNK